MMLLTQANRKSLPPLYSQDGKGDDAIAYVKYFCPWTRWTWFATEFDGEDTFFGLVFGDFTELGDFSLSELQSIKGPMGLKIERELGFKPTSLSEIREMMAKRGYT